MPLSLSLTAAGQKSLFRQYLRAPIARAMFDARLTVAHSSAWRFKSCRSKNSRNVRAVRGEQSWPFPNGSIKDSGLMKRAARGHEKAGTVKAGCRPEHERAFPFVLSLAGDTII